MSHSTPSHPHTITPSHPHTCPYPPVQSVHVHKSPHTHSPHTLTSHILTLLTSHQGVYTDNRCPILPLFTSSWNSFFSESVSCSHTSSVFSKSSPASLSSKLRVPSPPSTSSPPPSSSFLRISSICCFSLELCYVEEEGERKKERREGRQYERKKGREGGRERNEGEKKNKEKLNYCRSGNFCVGFFFYIRNVCAFNFCRMAKWRILNARVRNFPAFNFRRLSNWQKIFNGENFLI